MLPITLLLLSVPATNQSLTTAAPRDDEAFRRRVTPIVEVANAATPAVVFIQNQGVKPVGRDWWGQLVAQEFSGSGSGVVIHKDGFIITNYHVIEGAQKLTVSFDTDSDTNTYRAEVVASVPTEDLALLKINGDHPFPTIPLGTSRDLMLGEPAVAIGNPYGETHTVTQGIVSGLHRNKKIQTPSGLILQYEDLIQTDAGINPGNSGGPLLNINGELIGINSAMNIQAENIGFAIPVDHVKGVLEERMLAPETAPSWLGFEVKDDGHPVIGRVVPGSPAEVAGLRPGDCIVALGSTAVTNQDEYKLARVGLSPKSDVELKVERAGNTRTVRLVPWDRYDGVLYEHLGMKVETVFTRMGSYVRVKEVREGGPAAELGLKPKDVIDAVMPLSGPHSRAVRIPSRELFANFVTGLEPGAKLQVDVYRDSDGDGRYAEDELLRGTLELR